MASHPWCPITDLPDDWAALARPDIDRMLVLWTQEREHLADAGRVHRFQEQLATRWAIETGAIERLYTIDRGTTETLVELGLDAIEQFSTSGRLTQGAARLIEDQRAALDFVFAYIKDDRPLSQSYIKELHQLLMRNQRHTDAIDAHGNRFQAEVLRGQWKRLPNNPTTIDGTIHEYCPPEFVQDEMDRLIDLHRAHQELGVRPEVEAAWLHHRFTQIHPFQDGNGRVARALATMIFLKAGFVPLVIRDTEHRTAYLDRLEMADGGDLKPLVDLFANVQTADLNHAITAVREIEGRDIESIAVAAAAAARRRTRQDEGRVHETARHYQDLTYGRLYEAGSALEAAFAHELPGREPAFGSVVYDIGPSSDDLVDTRFGAWQSAIADGVRELGYEAQLTRHQAWAAMLLPASGWEAERWAVVVSFHHKDSRTDVMAAIVLLTQTRDGFGPALRTAGPVLLASRTELTISGTEPDDAHFLAWLDAALINALSAWQARI